MHLSTAQRVHLRLAQVNRALRTGAVGRQIGDILVGGAHFDGSQLMLVDHTAELAGFLEGGVAEQRMADRFDVSGFGADSWRE